MQDVVLEEEQHPMPQEQNIKENTEEQPLSATNEEQPKPKLNLFQKAQITPPILFVAVLTCTAYFWLYMFIGPACLSSIIVAISFILAFTIVCYIVYRICEREDWRCIKHLAPSRGNHSKPKTEKGSTEEKPILRKENETR